MFTLTRFTLTFREEKNFYNPRVNSVSKKKNLELTNLDLRFRFEGCGRFFGTWSLRF